MDSVDRLRALFPEADGGSDLAALAADEIESFCATFARPKVEPFWHCSKHGLRQPAAH